MNCVVFNNSGRFQAQNKREIDEFKAKRQEWRAYELDQMEKENQAILQFASQQNTREQVPPLHMLTLH